jgi:hypothetical protein
VFIVLFILGIDINQLRQLIASQEQSILNRMLVTSAMRTSFYACTIVNLVLKRFTFCRNDLNFIPLTRNLCELLAYKYYFPLLICPFCTLAFPLR